MNDLKDQDPDYSPSVANNEKHQRRYEENARSTTARKITAIIEKEFLEEISNKEKEVLDIQDRIHTASRTLHLLRYVIVTNFYNRKQCQASQNGEAKQTQIHPAIKQLIGKSSKIYNNLAISASTSTSTLNNDNYFVGLSSPSPISPNANEFDVVKSEKLADKDQKHQVEKRNLDTGEDLRPKKVPRYVPPKSGISETSSPSRSIRHKVRKRVIIGNISKWIPPEWREGAASHKWTMYVRGNKENPEIDDFVQKVRFFLHPSYRPNDVVEITSAPFCLSRRGWGEFPLRVQLHFKSTLNKPMDIIHHLKLDRTYTGLQTLGSETLVDIWIYADARNSKRNIVNDKDDIEFFDQDVSQIETSVDDNSKTKSKLCLNSFSAFENSVTNSDGVTYPFTEKSVTNQETCKNKSSTDNDNSKNISESILKNSVTSIERLRFYVDLDHDYFGSKYVDEFGKNNFATNSLNTTHFRHNLRKSISEEKPQQKEEEDVSKNNDVETLQYFENNVANLEKQGIYDNKVIPDINLEVDRKDVKTCTESSITTNELNERLVTMSSAGIKLQSNLRPLKISIPPLFESTGSKHVLVLQNNKTVAVDITVPRLDESTSKIGNSSTKSKLNFTTSRSVSLLKKPAVSDTEFPSCNTNKSETQVALRLKPSGSLLLNVNCNIPALKIAETRSFQSNNFTSSFVTKKVINDQQTLKSENQEESKDIRTIRPKITLGKDKYKLQSKKDVYDEVLRMIDVVKVSNIQGLLRFIIRRLPIITQDASDLEYRRLHPYACTSEEEFFGYSIAKRKACEWNRAKVVQYFLKKKSLAEEELWTVKEIIIWARLHGYTPTYAFLMFRPVKTNGIKDLSDSSATKDAFTCTEPIVFHKWLQTCPDRTYDIASDANSCSNIESDFIDVIEINEISDRQGKSVTMKNEMRQLEDLQSGKSMDSNYLILELDEKLLPFHNYVCETARAIGIKLVSEEIVPNVMYCASSRVVMRAVECFVDDLVRMSLAKAWEKYNDNGYPKVVTLDDVQGALLNREEFDIFTNKGLGSKCRLAAMD